MASPPLNQQTIDALKGVRFLALELSEGQPVDGTYPNTRLHDIAIKGKFDGHWQGPFEITTQTLSEIIDNASRQRVDIPVDYEHNSLNPFASSSPAAGWIQGLDISGQSLRALISWTDRAADHIRAREYRYLSPTIVWESKDRKTGKETGAALHSVALTNTPFLDDLPEVTLNRHFGNGVALNQLQKESKPMFDQEQGNKILTALSLGGDAGVDRVLDEISALRAETAKLEIFCSALSLTEGASDEEIKAKIVELADKAANAIPTEDLEAAKAETEAAQKELAEVKAQEAVTQATRDGKIVASNKEWATKLANTDLDAFSEWATAAPKIVPVEPKDPPTKLEDKDPRDLLSEMEIRAAELVGVKDLKNLIESEA